MSDKNNQEQNYIETTFADGGIFTFHGFGKLDGISIQLPNYAIRALIPAMLSYWWQRFYGWPERLSNKQKIALDKIAYNDIKSVCKYYAQEARDWRKTGKITDLLIAHDKSGFDSICRTVQSVKGDDGKTDADAVTPALFVLLNDFIKKNEGILPQKLSDWDKHNIRLHMAQAAIPDWDIDDYWFSEQEGIDA